MRKMNAKEVFANQKTRTAKDIENIKLLEESFKMNMPSVEMKPGRQRPRNSDEKEVLERWEKERGTKIGTI